MTYNVFSGMLNPRLPTYHSVACSHLTVDGYNVDNKFLYTHMYTDTHCFIYVSYMVYSCTLCLYNQCKVDVVITIAYTCMS